MKYWKVRITINSENEIIDGFYDKVSLEKEEELYKANEHSKQLFQKTIFECAYEIEGQTCGCKLNFKNTSEHLETGHYTLAKLPKENHKLGCFSDLEYISEDEFLESIDYKKVFLFLNKKNQEKYQVIESNNKKNRTNLERSINPLEVSKPMKIRTKKVLNVHKTLDYIFKRDQINVFGYRVSAFEKKNWKNTFRNKFFVISELEKDYEKFKGKVRSGAFRFKIEGIYKLNWNSIPKVFYNGSNYIIYFKIYSFVIKGNYLDVYNNKMTPQKPKELTIIIKNQAIGQKIIEERYKNSQRKFSLFFKEEIGYIFKNFVADYSNLVLSGINISEENGLMVIYENEIDYQKLW